MRFRQVSLELFLVVLYVFDSIVSMSKSDKCELYNICMWCLKEYDVICVVLDLARIYPLHMQHLYEYLCTVVYISRHMMIHVIYIYM